MAALIASACLAIFHLSDDTEVVVDTAQTAVSSVVGLRMTMTVIPIIGLLIAVFVFRKKFILTEAKVEEIAAQIKEKRAEESL